MKYKTLLFFVVMMFGLCAHASNARHTHPLPADAKNRTEMSRKMMLPGYCEIEIINRSYQPVHISGTFLNGDWLEGFDIYPYEFPHYISLEYWECDPGMYLTISDFNGYVIYSAYTPVYQTLTIYPISGQAKSAVKIQPKPKH